MGGRIYTCPFHGQNLPATNALDWFEVTPATNKPIRLVRLKLAQYGTADFGDAQDEGLGITIYRVPATATSGSGGSAAANGQKVHATDQASGFTFESMNTTVATTSGTLEELMSDAFNVRTGIDLPFEPENRFEFVNGTFLVVRSLVGPADAIATWNGTLWVEELG